MSTHAWGKQVNERASAIAERDGWMNLACNNKCIQAQAIKTPSRAHCWWTVRHVQSSASRPYARPADGPPRPCLSLRTHHTSF